MHFGHVFPRHPPSSFFWVKFLNFSQRREIQTFEVCEVRRAHWTLSVLLFVPHALLCRQGGGCEWWSGEQTPQTTPG